MRVVRAFFSAVALAIAMGSSLSAATPAPPTVRGTVKDSAGRPLPNVQVIVSALNRVSTSDGDGRFVIRGLSAGRYHLSTMLIGYAPGHADIVMPDSGADVTVSIVMREAALHLSSVQITATPLGSDPRDVPQSASELSGQALSRQLDASVAQTLSKEPGISVRYNGPAATSPIIRGFQGERILMLQDGDRSSDLSSAAPDHGVSLDPLAAQRIEVVRGPASLLYGNQALGGVVNVISNDIPSTIPNHVEGYLAGQAESAVPGGGVSAGVNAPINESFSIVARGGARHSDDLRQGDNIPLANSFYRNYYGVGGFGFGSNAVNGGAVYRGYHFNYGLPSDGAERSRIDGTRNEVVGRGDFSVGNSFVSSLRASATAQAYQHSEINEETNSVNTAFSLKTQTVDLLARTRTGAASGAIGVSGLFKQYAATGEEALTPAANSNGVGAFLFEELPLGDLSNNPDALVPRLQFGARYDLYHVDSRAGDPKFGPARSLAFNSFSGSVGATLPLGRQLSLGGSVARAFRAPSVEELFSNAFHGAAGTYDFGNPNLVAEVNSGFDGVLRLQSGRVNGDFAAYFNSVRNFITPNIVKDTTILGDDGNPTVVPLNRFSQGDATLKGLEGRVEVEAVSHVILGAMGDMTRGALKSGDPLPFMPAARLGALARWDNGRYSLEGEVRHAFAQDRVPTAVTEGDPSAVATTAYNLVNLNAGWNLIVGDRVTSIVLRADNLLDIKYADATSRIKNFAFNPGRNLSVVYKVLF